MAEGGDRHARRAGLIAAAGTVVFGGALAGVLAASGGGGRAGLAVVLIAGAASCAAGALYAAVSAVVDLLAGRPVGWTRAATAAGLFVLGAMLPAMAVGLGG